MARVDVRVDPSFLIVVLFAAQRLDGPTGITGVASWTLAVFVGVLVHEFGHALSYRAFGAPSEVTLYAMGGLTSTRTRVSVGRGLVVSLAGPLAGLALGGLVKVAVSTGVWPTDPMFGYLLQADLIFVCVVWGLANLLPLYPLDGGQALEAVLRLRGHTNAVRTTAIVGIVTAVAAGAFLIGRGDILVLLLLGWIAFTNWQRLRSTRDQSPPSG